MCNKAKIFRKIPTQVRQNYKTKQYKIFRNTTRNFWQYFQAYAVKHVE